ncbi:MAG: heme exporter protein [Chloroflexota bacterium]|jgi:heme exporter protein CcmB|nr:heme exporter protein [Chloroflexota bacterium]
MTLVTDSLILARKDLRIELRTRAALAGTLVLGAAALVMVGLAAGPGLGRLRDLAPSLTAIAALFASLAMVDRLDAIDRQNEAFEGLWLGLEDRRAIYLGKMLALTVLQSMLGLALWLLAIVLLDIPVVSGLLWLPALVVFGASAAAAATALVVPLVGGADRRTVLLPVVMLPMLVPTLLAMVNGSRALIDQDPAGAIGWTVVLIAETALFVGLGLLAYEAVATPE